MPQTVCWLLAVDGLQTVLGTMRILPGTPPPRPTVRITEPGRTPLHLVLRRPLEVGRDCDGLLLADGELSRRHLRLSCTAGQVVVEDLGSTNGTRIDGNEVVGPTRLAAGQVVTFGRCHLELSVGGDGRPTPGMDP